MVATKIRPLRVPALHGFRVSMTQRAVPKTPSRKQVMKTTIAQTSYTRAPGPMPERSLTKTCISILGPHQA